MGFLKKLKKAVKKVGKFVGKTNPLIPGGAAQKQLAKVAKSALPVVAGLAGASALTAAAGGATGAGTSGKQAPGGFLDGVFGTVHDVLGGIGDVANQAGGILEQFSPDKQQGPVYGPPAPGAQASAGSSSPTLKYVLIGAAAVGLVILLTRKR
jgi:hypothetical protein